MWTLFWDMHSGGSQKEEWAKIYIEASADEARVIFYNRFGHNPERVTCTCCGQDYSIAESESLEEASAYHRGCEFDRDSNRWVESPSKSRFSWQEFMTVDEYAAQSDVLIIRVEDIKPEERTGEVPEQGFVWVD